MQGPDVTAVTVKVQPIDGAGCSEIALSRKGRGVWTGLLMANASSRYWIEARTTEGDALRSPEAHDLAYSAVVLKNG